MQNQSTDRYTMVIAINEGNLEHNLNVKNSDRERTINYNYRPEHAQQAHAKNNR